MIQEFPEALITMLDLDPEQTIHRVHRPPPERGILGVQYTLLLSLFCHRCAHHAATITPPYLSTP